MAKDLKSFAREKLSQISEKLKVSEKEAEKVLDGHKTEEENIKSAYEKYKKLSKNDLLKEFLTQIENKKKAGKFNRSEVENIAKRITPMLNNEQKQMLKSILDSI
ncbi:MAG: hypothetical protein WCX32_00085 [Clostridia bacterium]|jgi:hypothetical protein|nr:hypothetical protein [Clostridia bacterium]MDD4275656.1 hypothetical protein [Clostridia bacterium]